jgi:Tfp pilus assembly protein PilO
MEALKARVSTKDMVIAGVIIGLAAAIVAGYFFVLRKNMQQEISAATAESQDLADQIAEARRIEKEIDQLIAEKQAMDKLVSDFSKRLPDQANTVELLTQFEELARFDELAGRGRQFNVNVESTERMRDERKETLTYSFRVQGTFHQVASYINRLERFQRQVTTAGGKTESYERYFSITDLEISEEEEGVCEATFNLSTYRFIEPTEGAAA